MIFAPVLAASVLQLAPPPPQITLLQLPREDLSAAGQAATQTILAKIQPAYVLIRPSARPMEPFQLCGKGQPAPEDCLARAMDRAGADAGEVVLASWEEDGMLHWLCVGRSGRAFTASRQSVVLGRLTDLSADGESELLHRAAACLTYGGHQSGW